MAINPPDLERRFGGVVRLYGLKKFKKFQELLKFLSKKNLMRAYKHSGNHITVNTVAELEIAKKNIKIF